MSRRLWVAAFAFLDSGWGLVVVLAVWFVALVGVAARAAPCARQEY